MEISIFSCFFKELKSHFLSSHLIALLVIQFSRFGSPSYFGVGGDSEIRTRDPLLARQVLSQLSYTPGARFFALLRIEVFPLSLRAKKAKQQTFTTSLVSGFLAYLGRNPFGISP